MRRTIIGGFIMFAGLLVTLTIIISGSIYATSMTTWSGDSKFWYAIFGALFFGGNGGESLKLGIPFLTGLLFTIIGFLILVAEYFETLKD